MFICVNEEITNATVNRILEILLTKDQEDKNITVFINSQGGCVDSGYAVHDLLRLSGCNITTYAVSEVFSSAIIIYLAGDIRYATEHSSFMVHEPFHEYEANSSSSMTAHSYRKNLKELQDSTNEYFKLISKYTTLTPQKIKNYISKADSGDWFFKASAAKNFGLVMRIGVPFS